MLALKNLQRSRGLLAADDTVVDQRHKMSDFGPCELFERWELMKGRLRSVDQRLVQATFVYEVHIYQNCCEADQEDCRIVDEGEDCEQEEDAEDKVLHDQGSGLQRGNGMQRRRLRTRLIGF